MSQQDLAALQARIRACSLCAYAHAPRAVVEGHPGARLLLVGQAPGATEERDRRPWTGPAGKRLLRWMIERVGFPDEATFRRYVYLSAVTRCYPGRAASGHGDLKPDREAVARCRPHLEAEFALVRPAVTLLVGTLAIESLLGKAPLDQVVGHVIPGRVGDVETRFVPLPHPSGASTWLNAPSHQARLEAALAALRELIRADDLAPLRN